MPRAGLTRAEVVRAGAVLADEIGYANLAMAPLAQRLGVRTPSLYKHVDGLGDLQRGIAALAMAEVADTVRDALQGRAGLDALAAFSRAFCAYILEHPGRYAATIGKEPEGPDDPMGLAGARLFESINAVLRGYDLPAEDTTHALRMLRSLFHGFATLQSADGFQWPGDPADTLEWMIRFLDRGLRAHAHPDAVR